MPDPPFLTLPHPAAVEAVSLPLLTMGASLLGSALLLQLAQYVLLGLELLTDDTLTTEFALEAAVATLSSSLVLLLAALGTLVSITALRRHGTSTPAAVTCAGIALSVAAALAIAAVCGGVDLAASAPPAAFWGDLDPTLVGAIVSLTLELALTAPLGAFLWHRVARRRLPAMARAN